MSIRLKYGMSGCDQCLFVGCFLHLRVGSVHATSLSIWIVCAPDVRVCVHRHTHMYMLGITSSPGLSESHSPQPPLCPPPPPSLYRCLRVISWSGIFISSNVLLLILGSAVTGMGLGDILVLHPPPARRTPCPFCLLVTET